LREQDIYDNAFQHKTDVTDILLKNTRMAAMKFNFKEYDKMLSDNNISVLYSGQLWADGIDGFAEMLQRRLDFEAAPPGLAQSVFSVFAEQMNNMLMYSAEKEQYEQFDGKQVNVSRGAFIMGIQDKTYFIQTRNVIKNSSIETIKKRIDYLNTLDKNALRQYSKEQVKAENDNPESKGAGLGFIEIARRASSKIEYEFESFNESLSYFTMYVTI